MSELALFEHAREALATAVRIDEVLDVRDAGERAKLYARQAKDRQLQADAMALVMRAERRLGEILASIKADGQLSAGGRPSNSNLEEPETGHDDGPVFDATPFTLGDLGISKNLSSRAQQIAQLDTNTFEAELAAKRDKILSTDAALIGGMRTVKTVSAKIKPAPAQTLAPEAFHRFAFSVLAMRLASDRVSSEAVHKLAELSGIVFLDGDTVDFSPEALEAMGPLAEVALKAIDGDAERRLNLREAYDGELVFIATRKGSLTMATAEAAMRAGYAAQVPVLLIAQDLGHPLGTVKTWAHRLQLTSVERMHATQHRFGVAS